MTQGTAPEVQNEMVRLYLRGEPVAQISEVTGVSSVTLYKILRQRGIDRTWRKGRTKRFQAEEETAITALRSAGWSKQELVAQFRTSYARVNRVLEAAGLGGRMQRRDLRKRILTKAGYVYIRADRRHVVLGPMLGANGSSYVLEHRAVLALHLGRPLEAHETVHHIDGNKANNTLQNLQLRSGKHGRGVALKCLDCGSSNVGAIALTEADP